eukprot:EG_transcript_41190
MFCKLPWLEHWLQNPGCAVQPNDLVVYLDAYDVLLQRKASLLLRAYERLARPPRTIAFCGDSNCWPFQPAGFRAHTRHTPLDICEKTWRPGLRPYLNAGAFMGPLADLRLMFQTLKEWHAETDDQAIMMLTYH